MNVYVGIQLWIRGSGDNGNAMTKIPKGSAYILNVDPLAAAVGITTIA